MLVKSESFDFYKQWRAQIFKTSTYCVYFSGYHTGNTLEFLGALFKYPYVWASARRVASEQHHLFIAWYCTSIFIFYLCHDVKLLGGTVQVKSASIKSKEGLLASWLLVNRPPET